MRVAVIQRLFRGLDNVGRRREIGLADLQVDDTASFRLERACAHQHFKSGFHKNPVHPLSQFHSVFLKNGTPSRVSVRTTRSSIETREPSIRPVTRSPFSSVTMATW